MESSWELQRLKTFLSEFLNMKRMEHYGFHESPEIMYNLLCTHAIFWNVFHSFSQIRFSEEIRDYPLYFPKLRMIIKEAGRWAVAVVVE